MRSLGIRIYGDDVLRKETPDVEDFDDGLRDFIEDMIETMIVEEGVGLAAPQVGVSKRIAVVNPEPGNPDTQLRLVNPRIVSCGDETDSVEEGCLSVPGIRGRVERPVLIEVDYRDPDGDRHREKFEGIVARIIQHEVDHLDGVLFVDRLSFGRRTMIKARLRELARRGK